MDLSVKIRSHPSLQITAKMGAAQPVAISYSGSRLQTRFFRRYDRQWLESNWSAADRLLARVQAGTRAKTVLESVRLVRNVEVNAILEFLDSYRVVDRQTDMNASMICDYIRKQNVLSSPRLTRWNIAVVTGSGAPTTFGGLEIDQVIRAPLSDSDDIADIKTLMSKEDLALDLEGYSRAELRDEKESVLKALRLGDEQLRGKGLLVLYPIDPASAPASERSRRVREEMSAVAPVIGLGLVFPRASRSADEDDAIRSPRFYAVDEALFPEEIDTDAEMYGGEE